MLCQANAVNPAAGTWGKEAIGAMGHPKPWFGSWERLPHVARCERMTVLVHTPSLKLDVEGGHAGSLRNVRLPTWTTALAK